MTKFQVIQKLCEIVALIYYSKGDYSKPSDCFCSPDFYHSNFEHSGDTLAYLKEAVIIKLTNDGFTLKTKKDIMP